MKELTVKFNNKNSRFFSSLPVAFLIGFSIFGVGCGKSKDTPPAAPQSDVRPGFTVQQIPEVFNKSYQYSTWSCSTGVKSFTSFDAYCASLLNDTENNNCASAARKMAHKLDCESQGQKGVLVKPSFTSSCRFYGEDYKQGLKLIKSASAEKYFFWDAKTEKVYQLLGGLMKRFGMSYFTLKPAKDKTSAASVAVSHRIDDLGLMTQISTSVGGSLQFEIENEASEKRYAGACEMDPSFSLGAKEVSAVLCTWKDASTMARGQGGKARLEVVAGQAVEKTLTKNNDIGEIQVRIVPTIEGQEAQIILNVQGIDMQKRIFAKAPLKAGIEVIHKDAVTGTEFVLNCAPASN